VPPGGRRLLSHDMGTVYDPSLGDHLMDGFTNKTIAVVYTDYETQNSATLENITWSPGRGVIEIKHSTEPGSLPLPPPPRISNHPEGKPCSDLGRVPVLNHPPRVCMSIESQGKSCSDLGSSACSQ